MDALFHAATRAGAAPAKQADWGLFKSFDTFGGREQGKNLAAGAMNLNAVQSQDLTSLNTCRTPLSSACTATVTGLSAFVELGAYNFSIGFVAVDALCLLSSR